MSGWLFRKSLNGIMKLYKYLVISLTSAILLYPIPSFSVAPFYLGAETGLGWRVNPHLEGDYSVRIADLLLKDIGFNSYRVEMYWERLETIKNLYSFTSTQYGYKTLDTYIMSRTSLLPTSASPATLLTLGYDNKNKYAAGYIYGDFFPPSATTIKGFIDYARAIASRYKDKVPIFEIWNEWNIGFGSNGKYNWSNAGKMDANGTYINHSPTMPEYYLQILRQVQPVIKSIAPNSKVLAGVTAGIDWEWTHRFIDAGGWKYVKEDGFSIHPYFDNTLGYDHKKTPEEAIALLDVYQETFRWWVHKKENIPFDDVADIPLYITEVGFSTYNGGEYYGKQGRKKATSDLIKYLMLVRARPYVKGVWIYSLRDREQVSFGRHGYELAKDDYDRERSYGLYYHDNPLVFPKQMAQTLRQWKIAYHLINGKEFMCLSDNEQCRRFGRDANYQLYGILGNQYIITWKDKKNVQHKVSWTRDETTIYFDGVKIVE